MYKCTAALKMFVDMLTDLWMYYVRCVHVCMIITNTCTVEQLCVEETKIYTIYITTKYLSMYMYLNLSYVWQINMKHTTKWQNIVS